MTAATRSRRAGRGDQALNAGLGVWTVIVFVFLFLPIIYIVVHSFTKSPNMFSWGGFTTKWYGQIWTRAGVQMREAVKTSLKAAVGSTVIAVVLGTLGGIALARRPGKWVVGFMAILLLILTTPEIVDAIGLQLWFVKLGGIFRHGLWPLWFGQSIFSSAVVALIVRARMAGMDDSLEDAAADLYAPPLKAFWQITMPNIAPAILAGALLSFTFSLDNVVITQFVSSPSTNTFPVYVFGLHSQPIKPYVAAMSALLLGITIIALGIVALVLRRSGDDSSKIAATLAGG